MDVCVCGGEGGGVKCMHAIVWVCVGVCVCVCVCVCKTSKVWLLYLCVCEYGVDLLEKMLCVCVCV